MAQQFFFVDPCNAGSNALGMEVKLLHILREDISDCVLSEDAVNQYVRDLNAAQDAISHDNPRLRRVEIKADIDKARYLSQLTSFIRVGAIAVPLRPVRKIQ